MGRRPEQPIAQEPKEHVGFFEQLWVVTTINAILLSLVILGEFSAHLLNPMPIPAVYLTVWRLAAMALFVAAVIYHMGHGAKGVRRGAQFMAEAGISVLVAIGLTAILKGEEFNPQHIPEDWAPIVMVTVVLTGVRLITRASRGLSHAQRVLEEQSEKVRGEYDRIRDSEQRLAEQTKLVEFARMTSNALDLRSEAFDHDGRPAVESALGTIRTWFKATQQAFEGQTLPQHFTSKTTRAAWWRCLVAYHNEERYDLARFELVTNVRNYAYLLISAIDEFRRSAAEREGAPAEIVIVQQSAFPPKDFYNFPHGTRGSRIYLDAEFYGVYRRVIATLFNSAQITPHRIVLCDNSSKDEEKKRLRDLGWTLDHTAKIETGCSHLLCAPYAVPLRDLPDAPADQDQRVWAQILTPGWKPVAPGEGLYGAHFCPVVPIVDGTASDADWNQKTNQRIADLRTLRGLQDVRTEFPQAGPQHVGTLEPTYLAEREEAAWADMVTAHNDLLVALGALRDEKRERMDLNEGWRKLEADRHELVTLCVTGSLDDAAQAKWAGVLGRILTESQGFDAHCAHLRSQIDGLGAGSWGGLRTVKNLAMGPAEAWLYHFCNYLDCVGFTRLLPPGKKLLPLWDVFCGDLLGLGRYSESNRNVAEVAERLRFAPIVHSTPTGAKQGDAEGVTPARLFRSEIAPEFTLIGVRDGVYDPASPLASVKWGLLITSEISEPFSTCRLRFCFDRLADRKMMDEHVRWVNEVWTQYEGFSKGVIERTIAQLPPAAAG